MGKYNQLAQDIVTQVGGKENVRTLTHCVTRLRFQLKDEGLANDDVLKNMDGVVTVMKSAGQYQVVIGNHVSQVYDEVLPLLGLEANKESGDAEVPKKKLFDALIDTISGVFQPVLGVMSAAGMLKGLNALFVALGWYASTDGFSILMNAIGDSMFLFLPIMLGYTSAKKFNLQPFLGLVIGASLCYPAIQATTLSSAGEPLYTLFKGTIFASPVYISVFGIPLIALDYTSTVIPVILIAYLASKFEKLFNKWIPETLKFFFVPMLTMFFALSLGFLVVGPLTTFVSNIVAQAIIGVRNISPLVAGAITGGFWQVLVIFGVHWGLIPVYMNNIATIGYDNIMAPFFGTTFAQTAVVFAMMLKTKDKKLKALSVPAIISGIFGITEPAIYGITLPRKKPFIISCIASAISGAFFGLFNLREYIMGGMGIFEFPSFIKPGSSDLANLWVGVIGVLIAMVVAFVLTLIFWKDEAEVAETEKTVIQPIEGEVLPLEMVEDAAFSQGLMGDGLAINPRKGEVRAPFNGQVTVLFPTKHAIGLTSDSGVELLIHVGMDTVSLGGEHFESLVKVGDKVKMGQKLLVFDMEAIASQGFSLVTPVIITNSAEYASILKPGLEGGQTLLEVK